MNAPLILTGDAVALTNPDGSRRNRRAVKKELTTARVIAAARFLFTHVGFFDVGIRDVAARIGMSTGAIFATVADKDELWRAAMNGPPPSPQLAEEAALLLALRPGWSWTLSCHDGAFRASLSPNGWNPLNNAGPFAVGRGDSPASALRDARINADRKEPLQ